VCYSRPAVYVYIPNFISIGLFCRPLAAKKIQFLPYFAILWTSAFSGVANWQQSQQSEKVEHGCTTTNLPLFNGIKIVLYSNAFMAKSGAQSLTFKSVTNKQTDKQTNKKTQRFGCPGGG